MIFIRVLNLQKGNLSTKDLTPLSSPGVGEVIKCDPWVSDILNPCVPVKPGM